MNRNLDSCPSLVVIINVVVAVESVEMVVAVCSSVSGSSSSSCGNGSGSTSSSASSASTSSASASTLACAFHWTPGYPACLLQAVVCPQLPSFSVVYAASYGISSYRKKCAGQHFTIFHTNLHVFSVPAPCPSRGWICLREFWLHNSCMNNSTCQHFVKDKTVSSFCREPGSILWKTSLGFEPAKKRSSLIL